MHYDPQKPLSITPPRGDFAAYVEAIADRSMPVATSAPGTQAVQGVQPTSPGPTAAHQAREDLARLIGRRLKSHPPDSIGSSVVGTLRRAGARLFWTLALLWVVLGLVFPVPLFTDHLYLGFLAGVLALWLSPRGAARQTRPGARS